MTGTNPIRLVLADVDGTLITKDKVLTARARQAVRDLRSAGIRFAITSGRPPRGMAMVMEPLQLDTPVAGFNGGVLVNPDMSVIEKKTLTGDATGLSVDLIRKFGLDIWLYTTDQWLITDASAPHVARETWTVQFEPTIVSDLSPYLKQAVKIVGVSDDLDAVRACEAEAQNALSGHATAARSQPYYLDVTHTDANKGAVVDTLARMLGMEPSSIATLGDQPNDVRMFDKSGMSIAMGNASEEVKARANHVTTSNEDEGFANAVEKFILKHSKQ